MKKCIRKSYKNDYILSCIKINQSTYYMFVLYILWWIKIKISVYDLNWLSFIRYRYEIRCLLGSWFTYFLIYSRVYIIETRWWPVNFFLSLLLYYPNKLFYKVWSIFKYFYLWGASYLNITRWYLDATTANIY